MGDLSTLVEQLRARDVPENEPVLQLLQQGISREGYLGMFPSLLAYQEQTMKGSPPPNFIVTGASSGSIVVFEIRQPGSNWDDGEGEESRDRGFPWRHRAVISLVPLVPDAKREMLSQPKYHISYF